MITSFLTRYPLLICFAFSTISILLTIHNKYIFNRVMKNSNCLLLIQNLFTLAAILFLKYFYKFFTIFLGKNNLKTVSKRAGGHHTFSGMIGRDGGTTHYNNPLTHLKRRNEAEAEGSLKGGIVIDDTEGTNRRVIEREGEEEAIIETEKEDQEGSSPSDSSLSFLNFSLLLSSSYDWIAPIMYSANVICGMWSLLIVNVVMFGALKRCTTIVSWVIEYYFTPSATTKKCFLPLLIMLVGTLIAGVYDMTFSLAGYCLAALSCITQGASYELGRRVTTRNKGEVCSVIYSNSVVSIVALVIILFVLTPVTNFYNKEVDSGSGSVNGDAAAVSSSGSDNYDEGSAGSVSYELSLRHLTEPNVAFHVILNCLGCVMLNYLVFLNCFINSPLAHTVTGNMKAVFTTVLGVLIFGNPMHLLGFIGLGFNFYGGFWFSYIKYKAKKLGCSSPLTAVNNLKKNIIGEDGGYSRAINGNTYSSIPIGINRGIENGIGTGNGLNSNFIGVNNSNITDNNKDIILNNKLNKNSHNSVFNCYFDKSVNEVNTYHSAKNNDQSSSFLLKMPS